jgi:hypothetical protein
MIFLGFHDLLELIFLLSRFGNSKFSVAWLVYFDSSRPVASFPEINLNTKNLKVSGQIILFFFME